MIGISAKETGTSPACAQEGKMDNLYRLQKGMERVILHRGPGRGISVSVLRLREKAVQTAWVLFKSRGPAVIVSVAMTVSVYKYCAVLAFLERGYKAYGGECVAALAAEVSAYRLLSWWGQMRR